MFTGVGLQEQPLADALQNRCSLKFLNIHRKAAPVLEPLSNRLPALRPANLLKRRQRRCFSVSSVKTFKNTYFKEHLPTAASV